jgi:hypothetical protein
MPRSKEQVLQKSGGGSSVPVVNDSTLAQHLDTMSHVSPLLTKAQRLGLRTPDDLTQLAVQRGCLYYDVTNSASVLRENEGPVVKRSDFSNAELAIALLSPSLPPLLHRHRVGAAMLSAPDVDPDDLAVLTTAERCENMVRYIAQCGSEVEPEHPFWKALIERLGPFEGDVHQMPHPTRFIEMTGITRGRIGIQKHWVRPAAALALAT